MESPIIYDNYHIIVRLKGKTRLIFRFGVPILLIMSIPVGLAHGAHSGEEVNVNGTVEYNISQHNLTADVYLRNPNITQDLHLHLGSADITEGDQCLRKSDDKRFDYGDYYMQSYCEDVEFEMVIDLNESVQKGDGFVTDRNRSDIGFLLRSQQEIRLENGNHWTVLFKRLDVEKSDGMILSDEYLLGGPAWESDNVTVGEDTVRVHHVENGRNDVRSLRNYSTPTDGLEETVEMFIITGEGNDTFGSFGGAYFPWTNSVVLREKMGLGATIHEYAHSQQEYETSEDMRWIIEGGATYDSTVAADRLKDKTEEEINERKSVTRPKVRNSTLANSSTWKGPASYSKGQSIIFLLDTCIEGRTDGDRDSRFLMKYLRTQTDNVTLNTLSYAVSHIVSSATETEQGELGEIKTWLKPYIYTDKNAEKEVLTGESYEQCWWNSDIEPESENESIIQKIKDIVDL